MGKELHKRIETLKNLLLDFGKSNRLINFKEGSAPMSESLHHRMTNYLTLSLYAREKSGSYMQEKTV
ncbi:hypothetical protein [Parabacteroides sp. ZJ-118]|uniref:hypothetical protein n=1 Tax=Parabacteroides sp. ZJ-118 TaxID=2709398 RepID=UPI0013EA31BB|nr:hypothetical protein [Parabacteroides sp. ZJ-118]